MISKLLVRSSAVSLVLLFGQFINPTVFASDEDACPVSDCITVWGQRPPQFDFWPGGFQYRSPDIFFHYDDSIHDFLGFYNPMDTDGDGLIDCWRNLTADPDAPITQSFNPDNNHWGFDSGVSRGTKLYAGGTGRVVEIERNITPRAENTTPTAYESMGKGRNGNFVRVNFVNGGQGTSIHMEFVAPELEVGDLVVAGQFIGTANNTGWSERSHLHYQYLENHTANGRDTSKARDPTTIHGDCDMDDQ